MNSKYTNWQPVGASDRFWVVLIGGDLCLCIMATNAGELQDGEYTKFSSLLAPECKWHVRGAELPDRFTKSLSLDCRKAKNFVFKKLG